MIANSLICNGNARILGKLYCNDLGVTNDVTFKGLTADTVTTIGALTSGGNFTVNGLNIYLGAKKAIFTTTTDNWLRINDGGAFTAGVYFGSAAPVRVDNELQVGSSGTYFKSNSTATTIKNLVATDGAVANLTADNAFVRDTLRVNVFEQNVVQCAGGTQLIAPTIYFADSATVNITAVSSTTVTMTITDSQITSNTFAGVTWYANSKVKLSGEIDGKVLGSRTGTVTANMNSTSHTLQVTMDYPNASTDFTTGTKTQSNLSAMLYQIYISSALHPVGIYMSSYGENKSSYVDIYGGSASSSYTTPNVRIGLLTGLAAMANGDTPSGWGIYTDNGFFKGTIHSVSGIIGGWTLGQTTLTSGTLGTNGSMWLTTADVTATKFAGADSALTSWRIGAGSKFGVTSDGTLYANNIIATGGNIGGASIVDGKLQLPSSLIVGNVAGGRNLMINTLYPSTTAAKRPRIYGQTLDTAGAGTFATAEHGLKATLSSATRHYIRFGSATSSTGTMNGLVAGKTYTLSFDAAWKLLSSATGTGNATTYYLRAYLQYDRTTTGTLPSTSSFSTNENDYYTIGTITQADKGTEMTGRCEYTFTVPENATKLYLLISANITTSSHYASGDYIEMKNIMLEESGGASVWSPAPEDIMGSFDNIYTAGTTTIDGGKITTNSISADSISVTNLSSISANLGTITGGSLNIGNDKFQVSSTGVLTATGADISGKITATEGAIGGFEITSTAVKTKNVAVTSNADNSISLSSVDFTRTINSTARSGLRFAMGDKFGITGDGSIYAYGGEIGGCSITNGVLSVPTANISGTLTASQIAVGMGGNLYSNYDTFSNITNDTLYYDKDTNVTATIDTNKNGYYGWTCAKLVTTSSGTDGYVYFGSSATNYGCVRVITGKKYRVSAYVKSSKASTSVDLYVVGHTAINNGNSEHTGTNATVGTAWTRIEMTYTAVADYPYISIRVDLNKASTTLYVDAIQVEEVVSDDQVASPFSPASPTAIDGNSIIANEYRMYVGTDSVPVLRLEDCTPGTHLMNLVMGYTGNCNIVLDDYNDKINISSTGSIDLTGNVVMGSSATAIDDRLQACQIVRGAKTLNANTAAPLTSNHVYLAIMWHNSSSAARGVYLIRNGNVFPIVSGSEISFSGMSSSSSFQWSNTGSNTSTCYFMRISG